ncbi:MAG TPA: phosphatidate cytidylyltransferase, partial [Bryobacteraceae bacterium]|nr:phosphatidate cytidylyltransferase [Bryobacteraceae bacterium]
MSRVLTALVLIPLVLYVVLWGPPWLVPAVASLVAVICYQEYSSIAAAYRMGDPGPLGYVVGLALMLAPTEFTLPLLAGCAILALTLAMRQADLGKALPRAALLVTGVVYIFGCWRFANLLHRASPYWLLFGLVLCWIGDAGAYYVGRWLGRHKLAPRI